MPPTHAQIAKSLIDKLEPGVFAHAARDATQHEDFTLLNRMLPEVEFTVIRTGPDDWELYGSCADGSVVGWKIGG